MAKKFITLQVTKRRRVKSFLKAIKAGFVGIVGQQKVEKLLITRSKRRFARAGSNPLAQKDPAGAPWPAPHPKTKARMRKEGRPNQLLKDTGRLRDSIQVIRGRLASGIGIPTGLGVRIGSKLPYARIHQLGSPQASIPRRRFMGVGKEDLTAVERLMKDIMGKSIGKKIR